MVFLQIDRARNLEVWQIEDRGMKKRRTESTHKMNGFATLVVLTLLSSTYGTGTRVSSSSTALSPPPLSDAETLQAAEKSQLDAEAQLALAKAEKETDEAIVAAEPITEPEYAEAKMGNTRMHRKEAGEKDACGHAYCSDLVAEYKPKTMPVEQFVSTCQKAHHDWELETTYNLSCDPQNPTRLKAQAAEELRVRTMKLIDEKRATKESVKADLYAADAIVTGRMTVKQKADVAAGRKQKKAGDYLQNHMDIPKHIEDKRDALKVRVRCKNGNKVGSVYSLKNNEKGRVPDCPPDLGNEVELNPNQGYLRTGDKVKLDAAFNE